MKPNELTKLINLNSECDEVCDLYEKVDTNMSSGVIVSRVSLLLTNGTEALIEINNTKYNKEIFNLIHTYLENVSKKKLEEVESISVSNLNMKD